jgi:putative protein-disulfide isomerase
MGLVHVLYYTDPACPWSWGAEPALRRLQAEFDDQVRITYVMGGLAREFQGLGELPEVLEVMAATGMPADPRLWLDRPPSSSYPACQGVKAAHEQELDGPYLRVLREGFMVGRRALDTAQTLVDAAREVDGMDVERFEIDLRSHATAEAFAADLDRVRSAAPQEHGDRGRVPFPSFELRGEDGDGALHGVYGEHRVQPLRDAAVAAGATPAESLPGVEEALARFGRMATAEVVGACDLPGPRAAAELWRLAGEWRVRAEPAPAGELWSVA